MNSWALAIRQASITSSSLALSTPRRTLSMMAEEEKWRLCIFIPRDLSLSRDSSNHTKWRDKECFSVNESRLLPRKRTGSWLTRAMEERRDAEEMEGNGMLSRYCKSNCSELNSVIRCTYQLSLSGMVESLDQIHYRTLTLSRRTDECERMTWNKHIDESGKTEADLLEQQCLCHW